MPAKAVLEEAYGIYIQLQKTALYYQKKYQFEQALKKAIRCLRYFRFAKQYNNKYIKKNMPVKFIKVILKCSVLSIDKYPLDLLEKYVNSNKRIVTPVYNHIDMEIKKSKLLLNRNYKLWNCILKNKTMKKIPKKTLLDWKVANLIEEDSDSLIGFVMVSNFESVVQANCENCYALVKSKQKKFLCPIVCPKCKGTHNFVLNLN